MDKLRELNTDCKNYYEQIKKIDSIKDIKQRIELFYKFYEFYWKYMLFLNKQNSNRIHNPQEAENVKKFKRIQKIFTEKKIEIDKILSELPDREIIIPFIMQKNKNQFSKSKNLANRIQINVENQNSKYVTNLSKEDIDNLSKELEDSYYLIIENKNQNPIKEYFLIFYDKYSKFMKELKRIKISKSKNNVDKIKKGLIAKKENIDELFSSLFINNQDIQRVKKNANEITPENIKLNNLNRIVFRHPPQNNQLFKHKTPTLNPNNILKLRKQTRIGQKPSSKNISRLNELQLKKSVIGLNKTEEDELRKILHEEKVKKNNNMQKNLNNFAARFPNLGINGKIQV